MLGVLALAIWAKSDAVCSVALELATDSHWLHRSITQLSEFQQIDHIIRNALAEDIGDGDVTTLNTVPETAVLTAFFSPRKPASWPGWKWCGGSFIRWTRRVVFTALAADGDRVELRQIIGTVDGPGQAILTGERVALNFLQRMSGIATLTRRFVDAVAGTQAVILDTRKTVPGLRVLDKWAVRLGGGQNHRIGLYDMAMIKDNHIAAVGGIAEAVRRVRDRRPSPSAHRGRGHRP